MSLFFILLFFIMSFGFLFFFEKKLLCLLFLEGLMISCVVGYSHFFSINSTCVLLILSIFMVLDSIFGITVFILSSRENLMEYYNT